MNPDMVINSEILNEHLSDVENIIVGEPDPGYDGKEHVLFSHNYFRRIPLEHNGFPEEEYAACLICVKTGAKDLFRFMIGEYRGLKKHLAYKHPDFAEKLKNLSKLQKYIFE